MKYDMADLAYYAGTQQYAALSAANSVRFDSIKLGTDGRFYLTRYSQGKDATGYQIVDLTNAFTTTIVRIRRKMVAYDETGSISVASHEYDRRNDMVPLSTDETMTEKQAKDKYTNIKVRLVLFLALPTGIAKLEVSGGSLYNKTDTDLRLYNYLQSYEANDHCFSATTYIKSKYVENEDTGSYYNMTFARGDAHSEEMLDKVGDTIIALKLAIDQYDAETRKYSPIFSSNKKESDDVVTPAMVDANADYSDIPF